MGSLFWCLTIAAILVLWHLLQLRRRSRNTPMSWCVSYPILGQSLKIIQVSDFMLDLVCGESCRNSISHSSFFSCSTVWNFVFSLHLSLSSSLSLLLPGLFLSCCHSSSSFDWCCWSSRGFFLEFIFDSSCVLRLWRGLSFAFSFFLWFYFSILFSCNDYSMLKEVDYVVVVDIPTAIYDWCSSLGCLLWRTEDPSKYSSWGNPSTSSSHSRNLSDTCSTQILITTKRYAERDHFPFHLGNIVE